MRKLILCIVSATAGLWIANELVPRVQINLLPDSHLFGFEMTALWQVFLVLGITLGLLQFFIKPVLNLITLPLRMITLGAFGFFVIMAMVWAVDYLFREFSAPWFWPLFWISVIVTVLDGVVGFGTSNPKEE